MKKKIILSMLVVLLVFGIIGVSVFNSTIADTDEPTSKYEKPTVQDITGLGDSPYEISSAASAMAVEKQWYEYIAYSNQPVGESEIDSNTKLVFYDPYSYTNATIMEIQGADDEWSSANTLSKTFTKTHSKAVADSSSTTETSSITTTNPNVVKDIEGNNIYSQSNRHRQNIFEIFTFSNNYNSSNDITTTTKMSLSIKASQTVKAGIGEVLGGEIGFEESLSEEGSTAVSEIADRFSKSIGSTHSDSTTITDGTSDSITRTFNATYFNQYGSPLQWKVVMYEVFLPIKVDMLKKVNGEWYVVDSAYCVLKTMNGFSRSYIKDNKTYVEDWGTGEPVLWEDFENSFFTPEKLIEAYKNRLMPNE